MPSFQRVTAHLCDDLPQWQTCSIMWMEGAPLIWASLNCVLLVTCSNLFSNIKKTHFLFCVLLYKPFGLPIPQLVTKINFGNTKTLNMYITPHCSVRPPIEIKMRASSLTFRGVKVGGMQLPKSTGSYATTAQYEAIWLTLIFWSKCPTWGHPDLGQPDSIP